MWHAQEHFNPYTQLLINLVSAHILARVWLCLFYTILCSFFSSVCLFYKIKTEEHSNLHNATLLRGFRFYVGENSRTFQEHFVEFKDFSRIYYKIQGLFKIVQTLDCQSRFAPPASSAAISFTFSWDERQTFAKWPLLLHLTHMASLAGHF